MVIGATSAPRLTLVSRMDLLNCWLTKLWSIGLCVLPSGDVQLVDRQVNNFQAEVVYNCHGFLRRIYVSSASQVYDLYFIHSPFESHDYASFFFRVLPRATSNFEWSSY